MAENTTEILKGKYQKILATNGISEIIESVTIQESGAKNDGMASVQQRVTIQFAAETCKKPLELFVKTHTQNPSHEAFLDELQAFETEAQFFMEYVPEARQLCESYKFGSLMNIYPKCYYADKSITVLENLVLDKQYMLLPHEDRHDFKTATIVLDSLATHHAISRAMLKHYGNRTQFMRKFPCFKHNKWMGPIMLGMVAGFFEMSLKTDMIIVEKNLGTTAMEINEKLKTFQGKSIEMTKEAFKFNDDDFVVLTHGDYKNNNMMFRKNPDSIVGLDQIVIDFQLSCCSSPALDLLYYFFTSVDPKVRQAQLKELLSYYLDKFNLACNDLNCPVELSYENLLKQYKQRSGYGFWYALALIGPGMSLIQANDEMDISKYSMEELADMYNKMLLKWIEEHPEKGKQMAQEVVDLLEEYNILSEK